MHMAEEQKQDKERIDCQNPSEVYIQPPVQRSDENNRGELREGFSPREPPGPEELGGIDHQHPCEDISEYKLPSLYGENTVRYLRRIAPVSCYESANRDQRPCQHDPRHNLTHAFAIIMAPKEPRATAAEGSDHRRESRHNDGVVYPHRNKRREHIADYHHHRQDKSEDYFVLIVVIIFAKRAFTPPPSGNSLIFLHLRSLLDASISVVMVFRVQNYTFFVIYAIAECIFSTKKRPTGM